VVSLAGWKDAINKQSYDVNISKLSLFNQRQPSCLSFQWILNKTMKGVCNYESGKSTNHNSNLKRPLTYSQQTKLNRDEKCALKPVKP
jgi:predicted Ser/Thr protein kinase